MSEPTIEELVKQVEYLELALRISETNERAAHEVIRQEREELERWRTYALRLERESNVYRAQSRM